MLNKCTNIRWLRGKTGDITRQRFATLESFNESCAQWKKALFASMTHKQLRCWPSNAVSSHVRYPGHIVENVNIVIFRRSTQALFWEGERYTLWYVTLLEVNPGNFEGPNKKLRPLSGWWMLQKLLESQPLYLWKKVSQESFAVGELDPGILWDTSKWFITSVQPSFTLRLEEPLKPLQLGL